MKEELKEVKKVWGRELIIVNCDKYCGKLHYLDKGAENSYHSHEAKQETFYCLEGEAVLKIGGKEFPLDRPITVFPGETHSFRGITDAVIMEVSTPHDDSDVYRLTESKPGDRQNGVGK